MANEPAAVRLRHEVREFLRQGALAHEDFERERPHVLQPHDACEHLRLDALAKRVAPDLHEVAQVRRMLQRLQVFPVGFVAEEALQVLLVQAQGDARVLDRELGTRDGARHRRGLECDEGAVDLLGDVRGPHVETRGAVLRFVDQRADVVVGDPDSAERRVRPEGRRGLDLSAEARRLRRDELRVREHFRGLHVVGGHGLRRRGEKQGQGETGESGTDGDRFHRCILPTRHRDDRHPMPRVAPFRPADFAPPSPLRG
ncbi:MAG: hypothetical protein IPH30_14345 [Betaproteobacteria bacterium]|nr:hypothetical protein [Betaproteobacteria bacterium]